VRSFGDDNENVPKFDPKPKLSDNSSCTLSSHVTYFGNLLPQCTCLLGPRCKNQGQEEKMHMLVGS